MVELKTMVEFQMMLMYAILVMLIIIGIRDYVYPTIVNLLHVVVPNYPWRV